MNTRNNQEVFDHVCNTFIRDRKPQCMNDEGDCVYSPQNDKQVGCAVGCLLENSEEWDDATQGHGVFFDTGIVGVYDNYRKLYDENFDEDQLEFLQKIQNFHDSWLGDCYRVQSVKRTLLEIADEYKLNLPDCVANL